MKGDLDGVCYRSVCNNRPATEYSHSTFKYYCVYCAHLIQAFENTQPEPFPIFDRFYKSKPTVDPNE